MFPNRASSGSTERADSKRHCRAASSVSASSMRRARSAKRASRCSRRAQAASTTAASLASRGSTRAPTGRGLASSSTLTNTRWELSVTVRRPLPTSSPQTRTPTSSEEVPTYSTWARRMAIWPSFTGARKSMSSMAPSTTVPWATRLAAIVPAWVIHCIIRPPWICPGAPACSGNTHWIISVTVSAIDGIG